MFKLFRKGKGPQDPKLQLWLRWFTAEIPKQWGLLSQYPNLLEFYDKMPNHVYTKEEIKKCPEENPEEYLINLFQLNTELSPLLNELPEVFSFCMSSEVKTDKLVAVFVPFLFRSFIKLAHLFPPIFNEAMRGDEQQQIKLNMLTNVLPVALSVPDAYQQDSFFLIDLVLKPMIELFVRRSPLIYSQFNANYLSRVLHICLDFIKSSEIFRPYQFTVYRYGVHYYNFWAENYMNESFGNLQLHDLLMEFNALSNVRHKALCILYQDSMMTIVEKSLLLLSFIFLHKNVKIDHDKIFLLGKAILKFFRFLIQIDSEFEQKIWNNHEFHFLVVFIAWTINESPIITEMPKYEVDKEEYALIKEYASYRSQSYYIPILTFLEQQTFKMPIFIHSIDNAVNETDAKPCVYFSPFHRHIMENQKLNELSHILVELTHYKHGNEFITLLITQTLTFGKQITEQKLFNDSINISPELMSLTIKFFVTDLLLLCDHSKVAAALESINGFKAFIASDIITHDLNLWSTIPTNEVMNIFSILKKSIFHILSVMCIDAPKYSSSIFNAVTTLMEQTHPEIYDDITTFASNLFKMDPSRFHNIITDTGFTKVLIKAMLSAQQFHAHIVSKNKYPQFQSKIALIRSNMFTFIDSMVRNENTKLFLFTHIEFVALIFHFLFEDTTQEFALSMITKGFHLDSSKFKTSWKDTPFDYMFQMVIRIFRRAAQEKDDDRWYKLVSDLVSILKSSFASVKPAMLSSVEQYAYMAEVTRVVKAIPKDKKRIKLANLVMETFYHLSVNNLKMRSILVKEPMMNIQEALMGQNFDNSTIDIILRLVYEVPNITLQSMEFMEIKNQKMLPYLHEITKHLPAHAKIFSFISQICETSVTNKLHVYESKFPMSILRYVASFESQKSIQPQQQASIDVLIQLFSTVSCFAFKWKTLFELFKVMQTKDNSRFWFTSLLMKTLSNILSNIVPKTPQSFIAFTGNHSGLYLPKIPTAYINRGFTLMMRFELSANYNMFSPKPHLISMRNINGKTMDLYITDGKLVLTYRSTRGSGMHETEIQLSAHTWYHLTLTFEKRKLKIYILGNQCAQIEVTGMNFEADLEKVVIGNSIPTDNNPEDVLLFNLSCMYMFSSALSQELIKTMSDLPFDFVYGLSPTNAKLFPNLPQQLFTDQMTDLLFACYNSRFAFNNVCANNARKDIGNAKVVGNIYSFSTSLCDVAMNIGGLKTFLPLFEQVELQTYGENKNDSKEFLVLLVEIIVNFCATSHEIRTDFFAEDGVKCIAYLMSRLNPELITVQVISTLGRLFNKLTDKKDIKIMIEDIWFNYFLIGLQTPQVKVAFIQVWQDLINGEFAKLLTDTVSVCKLVMFTISDTAADVRKTLWQIIKQASISKLNREDKDIFFNLSLSLKNTEIRIELMNILYELCVMNIHGICDNFIKVGFYTPFIGMMNHPNEDLRILTFKFILLIKSLEDSGKIVRTNATSFEDAMLKCIQIFNPENITEQTWNIVSEIFLDSPAYQSGLLPFVSYISQFYEWSHIEEFFNIIDQTTTTISSPLLYSFGKCDAWYFWLFYVMMSSSSPELNLNTKSVFTAIYSKVLVFFIKRNYWDKFQECEAFFLHMSKTLKLNTPLLQRIIYHKLLKLLQLFPSVSPDETAFVFSEIFEYVFYIPDTEIFHSNLSLRMVYGETVEDNLKQTMNPETPCIELLQGLSTSNYNHKVNFSARIDPRLQGTNQWWDLKVSRQLIGFATKYANLSAAVFKRQGKRIRYAEVLSLIFSYIIQASPAKMPVVTSFFKSQEFDSEIALQLFAHVGVTAIKMAQKDPSRQKHVIEFLLACKGIITKYITNGVPVEGNILDNTDLVYQIFEAAKEPIANLEAYFDETSPEVSKQVPLDIVFQKLKRSKDILAQLPQVSYDSITDAVLQRTEEFKQQITYHSISCTKAHQNMFKDLKTNGGPWSSIGQIHHWKVSKSTDNQLRHIFFKPNLNFDIHMKASLMRDGTTAEAAQNKYERWLDANKVAKIQAEEESTDEETTEFDRRDYAFFTSAQMVTIRKVYEGTFFINFNEFHFNDDRGKSVFIKLSDLKMVLHRSYLHIDSGLEFFMSNNKSVFIYFPKGNRNKVLKIFKQAKLPNIEILQLKSSCKEWLEHATMEWQRGQISNYEYLMRLNLYAGRSFNDLSQYPVFPWVLSNYTDANLDLNDSRNYRDFSKPVGAFCKERLDKLYMLLDEVDENDEARCLYRFHYSNAFYVVHWMIRVEPYTSLHIEMQDNMFDNPSRVFRSIPLSWHNVSGLSPDYRELIPEFFTMPEMLMNSDKFDLGMVNGQPIGDVELPPWASSATEFIQIHRNALESKYVSENLHEWIDLIFGYKQSGKEAVAANNTFHKFCYQSCITKEILNDPMELKRIQIYASNSGIVPRQIFNIPHPKRGFSLSVNLLQPNELKWTVIQRFKYPIIFIGKSPSMIPIVTAQCTLTAISLSGKWRAAIADGTINQKELLNLKKYITFPEISNDSITLSSRSFDYISESNMFIASSPWDSAFHVFRADANSSHYMFSQRQNYALISGVTIPFGTRSSTLVTRWRDSSISVWNLNKPATLRYRAQPHQTTMVDVDASANLNTIVSCDKQRNVIISRLDSGHFIRAFTVDGDDTLLYLLVISAGYIVIAGEKKVQDKTLTTLRCYTINGIPISQYSYKSQLLCITGVRTNTTPTIAVSFKDGYFALITVPNLKISFSQEKQGFTNLVYNDDCSVLFASDSNGQLLYLDL